jgi:hypothetical protein
MFNYVLRMLTQPSSYAGIGVLATAIGISAPAYQAITAAIAAVAGLVAFFVDGNKVLASAPAAPEATTPVA